MHDYPTYIGDENKQSYEIYKDFCFLVQIEISSQRLLPDQIWINLVIFHGDLWYPMVDLTKKKRHPTRELQASSRLVLKNISARKRKNKPTKSWMKMIDIHWVTSCYLIDPPKESKKPPYQLDDN